ATCRRAQGLGHARPTAGRWRRHSRRALRLGRPSPVDGGGGQRKRAAHKYSNAIGLERLWQAATDWTTCPNDRERPRRREFASRGSNLGVLKTKLGIERVQGESIAQFGGAVLIGEQAFLTYGNLSRPDGNPLDRHHV